MRRLITGAKKKIFLIPDNLRVHHGKTVNAWLGRHPDRIEVLYRIAFRRKIYDSIPALQIDLDERLDSTNEREHQGRWCYGKTPMRTYLDSLELAREKLIPHSINFSLCFPHYLSSAVQANTH